MSNQKVQLPAYANNPVYKFIDDTVTSLIVTIFDAINPKGIVLSDEQVKQIMQKQQEGGAYKGFVQDFLDIYSMSDLITELLQVRALYWATFFFSPFIIYTMVLILDGNSEMGAHVYNEISH